MAGRSLGNCLCCLCVDLPTVGSVVPAGSDKDVCFWAKIEAGDAVVQGRGDLYVLVRVQVRRGCCCCLAEHGAGVAAAPAAVAAPPAVAASQACCCTGLSLVDHIKEHIQMWPTKGRHTLTSAERTRQLLAGPKIFGTDVGYAKTSE